MNAHMKLMRPRSKKERAPRTITPAAEPRKRSPHGSAQNARLRLMRKRTKRLNIAPPTPAEAEKVWSAWLKEAKKDAELDTAPPTPAEAEKVWSEWSKANNEETE
jgi:hypothetical protein